MIKFKILRISKLYKFFASSIKYPPIELFFLLFALIYLCLYMHLPVSIYGTAGHDDALFIKNAHQILTGHWLGSYNQMTLAKGPTFPFFLAINAILGIPITLSTAVFYIFACMVFIKSLHAIGLNKFLTLVLFVLLLFHPALLPIRVIRDNICPALTLIVISGVINLLTYKQYENRFIKLVPYGLAFGFFWLTREDGIWIIPGIFFVFILKIIELKKSHVLIKPFAFCITYLGITAYIPLLMVSLINFYAYRTFETVDFKGSFSKVLKKLNTIDVGEDPPYIPVSFQKRQAIYNISPSFLELKDYFEDKGKHWTEPGCKIYPHTCGDYAGGWFMWAFRDAAADKNYYANPKEAKSFYENIFKEIDTACKNGSIKCTTSWLPLMPRISNQQLKEIPEKLFEALKLATVQHGIAMNEGPSTGALPVLQKAKIFLGNPYAMQSLTEETLFEQNIVSDKVTQYLKNSLSPDKIGYFLKNTLIYLYSILMPIMMFIGLLCYLIYLTRSVIAGFIPKTMFYASTMLWLMFFSRIFLVVLVDISSFPAINAQYLASGFPILCAASFLSIAMLGTLFQMNWNKLFFFRES